VATRSVKIAGAVVAGAILAGVAFKLGNSTADSPDRSAVTQTSATTAAAATATLVEFRSPQSGWAISYPKDWKRQVADPSDRDVVFLASEDGGHGSVKIRDIDLGAPVEEAKQRALTDQLVTADGIQQITQPAAIHQGGLPGTFYFYSFRDGPSGQEGVHSHYFLFKGSRLIVIVFQALPKDDFRRLANLFDSVIGSFRVL